MVTELDGDLLHSIATLSVEVVILQIEEKEILPVIEQIGESFPFVKAIVITMHPDQIDVVKMLRAGARGCLSARLSPKQIAAIVEQVIISDIACFPRLKQLSDSSALDRMGWADKLTSREKEILVYLAKNLSNMEIAANLFLAESTIKTHIRNIIHRLGVRNRLEAITMLQQHCSLDDSDNSRQPMPNVKHLKLV